MTAFGIGARAVSVDQRRAGDDGTFSTLSVNDERGREGGGNQERQVYS